ncbi:reverse transcriptase domain-containing protein [Tanacetum coccineum]
MRTKIRSQSREQHPPPEEPPVVIEPLRIEYPFQEDPPVEPMADTRTMAQLLQAPTEGYEDAILIPEIVANNFELRHGFNESCPSTNQSSLMLFPFSIEGAARIWLEKEPPRSIQTWDDLVSKFINQFFPPSKTTNLRNEITRFQQRFIEPAAVEDFLDKIASRMFKNHRKASPKVLKHELRQLLPKVSTNSSTQAVSSDVVELKDIVRALLLDKKNQASAPAPAPSKHCAIKCVTAVVPFLSETVQPLISTFIGTTFLIWEKLHFPDHTPLA